MIMNTRTAMRRLAPSKSRPAFLSLPRGARPLSSSPSAAPSPPTPRKLSRPAPFRSVDTCPPPTTDPLPACDCDPTVVAAAAATADLDIDRAGKLEGAFSPYAEQVLVCTGKDDWASRVEEDEGADGGGDVLRGFKALFGRGGRFSDVGHFFLFLFFFLLALVCGCLCVAVGEREGRETSIAN